MSANKYKKSQLTKHIWLGLAVFFLIFTSNPVKKFIQLSFFGHAAPIETSTGERLTNSCIKVCSIADRHQLSSRAEKTAAQSPAEDTALILSELLAFALLYFSRTTPQQVAYVPHRLLPESTIPLYLSIRKLQV